jgi:hypothetical protein
MSIYWSDFSWEAFATIWTALVAVAGAVWVGHRQTRILEQQSKLTETNLRIQLLERRTACITTMQDVVAEWHREANLSPERFAAFQKAFNEAELLFSKKIATEMEAALGGLFWAKHWQRRSYDYHQRGKSAEAGTTLEKSFAEDDKVFRIMPGILDKLKGESRVSDWT